MSTAKPNFALFEQILSEHVAAGSVDYAGISKDLRFSQVIDNIGSADLSTMTSPQEKLGFYINAYNALVIKNIIDGRSPATLWGRIRFFVLHKQMIAGEKLSLLEIERKRIIPLGDPRSHFAINCASASCPILDNKIYQPDQMDAQLDNAARRFIRASTDVSGNSVSTSRIFKWYRDEFERTNGGLKSFLSRYLNDDDESTAVDLPGPVSFDQYSWKLNGRPPK